MGAGHYYAFIRPNLDDKWFEFNDSNVVEVLKSTALTRGYGGFETKFEFKDGKVIETKQMTHISAYMLVYVREGDRDIVMSEIGMQEIPNHLKERFDEENQTNAKLQKD
jgi:ubiquitin carboxyl-terminal hydrolase 7